MVKFSPEMLERLKDVQDVAAFADFAREYGVALTMEAAAGQFAKLRSAQEEMSDDELQNVSGGGCKEYHTCPVCGGEPLWCSQYIVCAVCRTKLDYNSATGKYSAQ